MNGSGLDGKNLGITSDDPLLHRLLGVARARFERRITRRVAFGYHAVPPPGLHARMAWGLNGAHEMAAGIVELEIRNQNIYLVTDVSR